MNSKTNTKIFFLFIASLLFSYSTMGRSPAVEPVTGISIDQYREVDPKNDPGFKWDQDQSKHNQTLFYQKELLRYHQTS